MVMQVLMEEQAIEHMLRIFKIVILNKKHCQSRKSCAQEVLRTRKKSSFTKLPPKIYQKFTSRKTQRKYVNQTNAI